MQAIALVLALGADMAAQAASIITTIVTDPLTGVAIDGFDPVSYFTEASPVQGRGDFEYDWGGVPWYFANAANRDVFMRNPDIYAPQYGGHGTMSAARGFLSDGNPRIYRIHRQKLYFFYSTGNRDAFDLVPDATISKADENWKTLKLDLLGD